MKTYVLGPSSSFFRCKKQTWGQFLEHARSSFLDNFCLRRFFTIIIMLYRYKLLCIIIYYSTHCYILLYVFTGHYELSYTVANCYRIIIICPKPHKIQQLQFQTPIRLYRLLNNCYYTIVFNDWSWGLLPVTKKALHRFTNQTMRSWACRLPKTCNNTYE